MSDNFNALTPAEAERLAMLAEECGEVIQIIGKILRHGYESRHPNGGPTNRMMLLMETTDLRAVLSEMVERDDIRAPLPGAIQAAWDKKLIYSHHQEARHE